MDKLDEAYELNNPPVIAELLEDEIVAIDLDAGSYFSIRGKAAQIFGVLAGGSQLSEIVKVTSTSDDPSLKRELVVFVERCLADNLLRPRRATAAAPVTAAISPWAAGDLRYETFTDMQNLLGLDPVHEADEKLGWPVTPGKPST